MIIKFSDEELNLIKQVAHLRNDPKEGSVNNYRIDESRGDYAIHCQGVAGELAVAKALNIEIDSRAILHGDGGIIDLKLPDSRTIQVKYRNFSDRSKEVYLYWNHLDLEKRKPPTCSCCHKKVRRSEVFLADIGTMVVPHTPGRAVEIMGYVTKEDFLKKYTIQNFGYGNRYAISHKDLEPITNLIKGDANGLS